MLYLDSDVLLGLVKPEDRLKTKAVHFIQRHDSSELVTSSMALLEVWFHYYKNNLPLVDETLLSMRSLVAEVWDVSSDMMHASIALSKSSRLSPIDAIHAFCAKDTEGIVSSDSAYDRVAHLRRIDFTR